MQTAKWGPPGWNFLHCLPLCSSDQWSPEEKRQWIDFFDLLRLILPCKYCRASYQKFIADDPLQASLDSGSAAGHCQVGMARWLWTLHNKVNLKLDKQQCAEFFSKCCQLNQRPDVWEDNFWKFVLTIVWNYKPEDWRTDAYRRFFGIIPTVLARTPLGQRLNQCLNKHRLSSADLANSESLKQWGWSLWSDCHNRDSLLSFNSFAAMDSFFEGWRSKTCSSATPAPTSSKPATC